MTGPLIDTHCHLDFDRYEQDLDAVLERARTAGVTHMVTVGCARDPESAARSLALARRFPERLRATVGVHPHDARFSTEDLLVEVERLASEPLVVAVGEMGLDYHYDGSPRHTQREVFRRQVAVARRAHKPIVVHTREAPVDTLRILREENARDVGGVIHCFSEDAAFAARALDLGFVSSFSGLVTFSRGTEGVQDAATRQPDDALLLETDAPFLAPHPHRGKRNEPSFVAHTADFVARLRGVDTEQLRHSTTANARRIFRF